MGDTTRPSLSPERAVHDALYAPDCDCEDPERLGREMLGVLDDAGYVVVPREDVRLVLRAVSGMSAATTRDAATRLYEAIADARAVGNGSQPADSSTLGKEASDG